MHNVSTIDRIPKTSPVAADIENIAIFSDLSKIKHLQWPARIDLILSILCEEGTLDVVYDNHEHRLSNSCLMVLHPGHVIHSYKASPDYRGHIITISLKSFDQTIPMMLPRLFPLLSYFHDNPVVKLTDNELKNQTELRTLLSSKAYSHNDHACRSHVVKALLEALFFETMGVYTSHMLEARNHNTSPSRSDTMFYDFMKLVDQNFRTQRSVAFYADKLCVTPKHLSAAVRRVSTRTAGQWIDTYVVAEAKKLLRTSGMTVQEISTVLNFPNQSFFGKFFKRITGQSPRDFRSGL